MKCKKTEKACQFVAMFTYLWKKKICILVLSWKLDPQEFQNVRIDDVRLYRIPVLPIICIIREKVTKVDHGIPKIICFEASQQRFIQDQSCLRCRRLQSACTGWCSRRCVRISRLDVCRSL